MEKYKVFIDSPKVIEGVNVFNDEDEALEHLLNGEKVARFEYGDSMSPILESGQYCVLSPIKSLDEVNIGDAVFCRVNGYLMTHMVLMKSNSSSNTPKFLISSSGLSVYGWTDEIFAIAKGIDFFEKPRVEEYNKQLVQVFLKSVDDKENKDIIDMIKENVNCEESYARYIISQCPTQIGYNVPLSYAEKLKALFEAYGAEIDIKYNI